MATKPEAKTDADVTEAPAAAPAPVLDAATLASAIVTAQSVAEAAKKRPYAATPKEDGVEPVVAVHSIVYGNQQTAAPQTMFTPHTAAERVELFLLNAVRELEEGEQAVWEKISAAAEDVIG